MSHFISTNEKNGEKNQTCGSIYEIISPKLMKSVKDKDKEEFFFKQNSKLIKSFVKKEQDIRQNKQKLILLQEFEKIKKRIRNKDKKNSSNQCSLHNNSISKDRIDTSTVYIDKKYNNLISLRINALKEIQSISENKKKLIKWNNLIHNSTVKSPNFNKMNFLLEKIKQEAIDNQIFQNPPKIKQQNKFKILNKYIESNYTSLSKFYKNKKF